MIREALGQAPSQIGFKCHTKVDDSPEAMDKTSIAVCRAKRGDQEALRFLYLSYASNIYGYVRAIVRDDYEAEDVTQQVFAKLITTLGKYDDQRAPFIAWLLRLAHNVAIDQLRANRFEPRESVIDSETSSSADFNRAENLRVALAALPEKQRDVVILYDVAGLSHGEIADRLGQTQGSVRALHHRGRQTLQRELKRLESTPVTRAVDRAVAA